MFNTLYKTTYAILLEIMLSYIIYIRVMLFKRNEDKGTTEKIAT